MFFVTVFLIYNGRNSKINEASIILYSDTENITIDNSLPVSDDFGREIHGEVSSAYKYLDFEIVNVSSSVKEYQIFINKNDFNTNEINNDFVKFYLTDDKNYPLGEFDSNKIPSYVDLRYIKDLPSKKLLYTGKIDKYQRKKFVIKVWVSDNYSSLSKSYFSFDIGARAV